MLPELSAVLGVSIDELFEQPEEAHLRRVEAMLERETMLSRVDFDYAMARAREGVRSERTKGRCLTLLADLCMRRAQGETYHVPLYEGWIAFAAGEHAQAEAIWDGMVRSYADSWLAWSARADAFAKQARYDEAIAAYRESIARQTPPRYTDNEESIAQICAIRGDAQGAIAAYEQVVRILREDWGVTEGETVEGYKESIVALRAVQKGGKPAV